MSIQGGTYLVPAGRLRFVLNVRIILYSIPPPLVGEGVEHTGLIMFI